MDYMSDIDSDFIRLVTLLTENRDDEAKLLVRKSLASLRRRRPDLASEVKVAASALETSPLRFSVASPLPVDSESRLELLRREVVTDLSPEPIWPLVVSELLRQTVAEQESFQELLAVGLTPARTVLFVGAPGVGKTLAARWLARELHRPLLVLDLAAVMSSLLGRTGANLRTALEHAKLVRCVLLLDEFDAIAKSRSDGADVGELKRLVTVLLQAIDDWPRDGLMIAATNHPELLDRAIWRRFDRTISFPAPSSAEVMALFRRLWQGDLSADSASLVSASLTGASFADVNGLVADARRRAIVRSAPPESALVEVVSNRIRTRPKSDKLAVARALLALNLSQRQVHELTGMSRDTLRKYLVRGKDGSAK